MKDETGTPCESLNSEMISYEKDLKRLRENIDELRRFFRMGGLDGEDELILESEIKECVDDADNLAAQFSKIRAQVNLMMQSKKGN